VKATEDKAKEFIKLYQKIEENIKVAETECVAPLHSAWEHQRHAIHDFFEALDKTNEDDSLTLLGEAEGHLYSAAIYSWQEVAARELALTRNKIETERIKNYSTVAEIYERAMNKYSGGRKLSRKDHERISGLFKECISLCREARKNSLPITIRDDVPLWLAAGSFLATLLALILKLSGVY
jgi:hypothetical protein